MHQERIFEIIIEIVRCKCTSIIIIWIEYITNFTFRDRKKVGEAVWLDTWYAAMVLNLGVSPDHTPEGEIKAPTRFVIALESVIWTCHEREYVKNLIMPLCALFWGGRT